MVGMAELALRFSIHLANILLPLLLAIGCLLAVERLFFFHRSRLRPELLLLGLRNLLAQNRTAEALALCEETPGPLARVVKRLLLVSNQDPLQVEREYQRQEEWEVQILERRMGTIALIARMLPQIGLLGTACALFLGFLRGERLAVAVSASAFADVVGGAFSATLLGIAGGLSMDLAYHILHGRLRSCVREIRCGAREFFCEWLAKRSEQSPC
ncbi:MAG: MotA/TolQ/ExbB proton channel family protein [Puniceicoccales bacterium]|jgi:biopolymer transport protein ExbB|nr:MotA/TolQ/ExbB proton channel family protein [Puniceicoccales bacterium]